MPVHPYVTDADTAALEAELVASHVQSLRDQLQAATSIIKDLSGWSLEETARRIAFRLKRDRKAPSATPKN